MKNINRRITELEHRAKSIERVTLIYSDGSEKTVLPCDALTLALEAMSISRKDRPCPIVDVSGDAENNLLTSIIQGGVPCWDGIEPPYNDTDDTEEVNIFEK